MKMRISIFTAMIFFGVTTALGLAAILAVSTYANRELRVGGPLYSQIKLGNDLVADILPPPAYVVEAGTEGPCRRGSEDQTGPSRCNVQQAAQGTQQVSSSITDVQRGASETGSASSQVLLAAQSLSTESNRLKLEVGKFLSSVRAA
jgi:hypothetical protein